MAVIKVKSTHLESQGPFIIIEAEDFNPEIHTVYQEGEQHEDEQAKKKPGRPAKKLEE